jgi:hypothetical protein
MSHTIRPEFRSFFGVLPKDLVLLLADFFGYQEICLLDSLFEDFHQRYVGNGNGSIWQKLYLRDISDNIDLLDYPLDIPHGWHPRNNRERFVEFYTKWKISPPITKALNHTLKCRYLDFMTILAGTSGSKPDIVSLTYDSATFGLLIVEKASICCYNFYFDKLKAGNGKYQIEQHIKPLIRNHYNQILIDILHHQKFSSTDYQELLSVAILEENIEIATYLLLEKHAKVKFESYISWIISDNRLSILKLFIQDKPIEGWEDVSLEIGNYQLDHATVLKNLTWLDRALNIAIMHNKEKISEYLIARGANLSNLSFRAIIGSRNIHHVQYHYANYPAPDSSTIAHAIEKIIAFTPNVSTNPIRQKERTDNIKIIQFVIDHYQFDIDNPLTRAMTNNKYDIVEMLLNYTYKAQNTIGKMLNITLERAAWRNDIIALKMIADCYLKHYDRIEVGILSHLLCQAAGTRLRVGSCDPNMNKSRLEIIQLFIKLGAGNINTALVNAAKRGTIDVMRYLIEIGAKDFNMALLCAVDDNDTDKIQLLLEAGASNLSEALANVNTRYYNIQNGRIAHLIEQYITKKNDNLVIDNASK